VRFIAASEEYLKHSYTFVLKYYKNSCTKTAINLVIILKQHFVFGGQKDCEHVSSVKHISVCVATHNYLFALPEA